MLLAAQIVPVTVEWKASVLYSVRLMLCKPTDEIIEPYAGQPSCQETSTYTPVPNRKYAPVHIRKAGRTHLSAWLGKK